MKHYRHAVWLSAVLTSCVVGSFSIVEELPSGDAGGSSAGSANGGKSSGGGTASNGGTDTPSGGKAQGGQTTQGGTGPQAGEPTTGDAGEASSGGAGGDASVPVIVAPKPCDAESGVAPILCDDFEAQAFDNKWNAPAGVAPEVMVGPHGANTRAAHLKDGQQLDGLIPSFGLDGANGQVSVSFWFKQVTQVGNEASLVEFQSQQNAPIQLVFDVKGLYWSAGSGAPRAPTVSTNGNIVLGQWHCVSIYLTKGGNMTLSYFSASQPLKVQTIVVDQTPTPNVDDVWLNQPEPLRTILGRPKFGSSPVEPSDVVFDDVRIIHGKSNVCGL